MPNMMLEFEGVARADQSRELGAHAAPVAGVLATIAPGQVSECDRCMPIWTFRVSQSRSLSALSCCTHDRRLVTCGVANAFFDWAIHLADFSGPSARACWAKPFISGCGWRISLRRPRGLGTHCLAVCWAASTTRDFSPSAGRIFLSASLPSHFSCRRNGGTPRSRECAALRSKMPSASISWCDRRSTSSRRRIFR